MILWCKSLVVKHLRCKRRRLKSHGWHGHDWLSIWYSILNKLLQLFGKDVISIYDCLNIDHDLCCHLSQCRLFHDRSCQHFVNVKIRWECGISCFGQYFVTWRQRMPSLVIWMEIRTMILLTLSPVIAAVCFEVVLVELLLFSSRESNRTCTREDNLTCR